jgi:prolyl-tRNA editing enzyme YbaK/EbsC (Cys-tRNA(Pro) deacylase)
MWAPLTGVPAVHWRRDTSLMTEIGNSVERVRVALQKAGHPDTIEVFPDGTRTAQDAAAAVGCTVAQIAKSIVLRAGEQVVLVMTSGVNRVDVEKISCALGIKAKAADGRWVRDTTGFAIGGVAPVGHIGRPRVFIDADLMTLDPIWAAAGSPHHVFRSTPSELVRLTGGTIVDVKEE